MSDGTGKIGNSAAIWTGWAAAPETAGGGANDGYQPQLCIPDRNTGIAEIARDP